MLRVFAFLGDPNYAATSHFPATSAHASSRISMDTKPIWICSYGDLHCAHCPLLPGGNSTNWEKQKGQNGDFNKVIYLHAKAILGTFVIQ